MMKTPKMPSSPSPPPKLLKWEFWPIWLIYLPVAVWLFWQGVRKGSIVHFLSANPGLRFGGLLEYSKSAMLRGVPAKYLPRSYCFSGLPGAGAGADVGAAADEVEAQMRRLGLGYPVFLKPDMGERGLGVERLHGRAELLRYLGKVWGQAQPLILQEDIAGGSEYGVMLAKEPGTGEWRITSMVIKEVLAVRGDGVSTLAALIRRGERSRYHRRRLEKLYYTDVGVVLPAGQERVLVDIGSHSRGATFKDGRHLISPALATVLAPLADCIPGFYVGRFDLKARDIQALEAGDFAIIEVNGVNSEPAHMYALGLFTAWAHLLRHWQLVSRISVLNIKKGARPEPIIQLLRALRRHQLLLIKS